MEWHKAAPTTSPDAMCEEKNRNNHWVVDPRALPLLRTSAHRREGWGIQTTEQRRAERHIVTGCVCSLCAQVWVGGGEERETQTYRLMGGLIFVSRQKKVQCVRGEGRYRKVERAE